MASKPLFLEIGPASPELGIQPTTRRESRALRNGLGPGGGAELRPRLAKKPEDARRTERMMRLDEGGGRRYAAKSAFLVLASSFARRGPLPLLTQALNVVLSEKERRGLDLYARIFPKVTFINVSPDIGELGYLDRFNARALVLRGYREALRELAAAKDRGVFDLRPDLKLVGGG